MSRIDYHIEKYQLSEDSRTPRIAQQWQNVLTECQRKSAGSEDRLRTALLTVDYVTSLELPFRLLLTRAPQLIDKLRNELRIFQKPVSINGKKRGTVYSLNADLTAVPDAFHYQLSAKIHRAEAGAETAAPYASVARKEQNPRDRLSLALRNGLTVTALDGLLFFGIQRLASDVSALRREGMNIAVDKVTASDSLTGTTREIPCYRLA